MLMVSVRSTNIRSAGYSAASRTLEIVFRSGGRYQYFGVPDLFFERLIKAKSAGRFFHDNIKDRFKWRRL
jgi:hypothetical protein